MLNENEFYERFSAYEKEKLFDIIINKDRFQKNAVLAAKRIIVNKNLSNELVDLIESLEVKKNDEESMAKEIIAQKADYYANALKLKKENNHINIRTSEIIRFEAALQKESINYFSEDRNVDAFMAHFPTHAYYFHTEDLESVDLIVKQLQMTDPHLDQRPFFKFELKMIAIAVAVFTFLVLIVVLLNQ